MIEPYQTKTLSRLKKAKGQIEGIMRMIEDGKYCVDISMQVLALEGSLKAVSRLVLESHLNTCGIKELAAQDSEKKQKFIKDILKIVEFSNR